jgi:hypothetical protein
MTWPKVIPLSGVLCIYKRYYTFNGLVGAYHMLLPYKDVVEKEVSFEKLENLLSKMQ